MKIWRAGCLLEGNLTARNEIEKTFYKLDRAAVRDLAEVWKPGVPSDKNPQYIARARELNRELEAALLSRFADKKKKMIEDDAA